MSTRNSSSFLQRVRSLPHPHLSHRKSSGNQLEDRNFGKVLLLGTSKVGKTATVRKLCIKGAGTQYSPTLDVCTYDLNTTFQTEDNEKITKKTLKKKNLDGKARNRSISQIVQATDENGNLEIANSMKNLKRLRLQMIDTPSDFHITAPIEYRAMLTKVQAFVLLCDENNPDSITYVEELLTDLNTTGVEESIPRIIVVTNDTLEGIINLENIQERFKDYNVTVCGLPLHIVGGINNLTLILLDTLNHYDDQQQALDAVPKDVEFIQEGKRKLTLKKSLLRTISH